MKEKHRKALREVSVKAMNSIMDQMEAIKADQMMDDVSISLSMYMTAIINMGSPTLSELAARVKRSKPSVTIAVDKLEGRGYVKRVQAADDHRSFHIHLTSKGKKASKMKKHIEDNFDRRISKALNENELMQFIELNRKIFA